MKVTVTFSIEGEDIGAVTSEHPTRPAALAWTGYAETLLILIQDRDVIANQMVKLHEP